MGIRQQQDFSSRFARFLLSTALLISFGTGIPRAAGSEACPELFSGIFRTKGHFQKASDANHASLGEKFKKSGLIKPLDGRIERVTARHLAVDLNSLSPTELKKLGAEGRAGLPSLYYFTSGAGLWSRGGGQVKALIPFNLKSLLSEKDFENLVESGEIANASKPADVLSLAHREVHPGESIDEAAAQIVKSRKALLSELIAKARARPEALTPLDMKFVTVAIASRKAGTYIPFDVWTSEQTHGPIRDYLDSFERTFQRKKFDPDPEIDRKIKNVLGDYLAESRRRGETHLFGYQVGYHALHPETGAAVRDTAIIGEGAGMARSYLEESGRAAELRKIGKHNWVFENIEVLTDLPIAFGAYLRARTPVSVILVPEKQGYKGGSPFFVEKGGKRNLELHEMSVLPKEFASGNEYFNSNTIFQSLDLAPPKTIGFEEKNNGTGKIIRAKMNAGDITHDAETSGIGGRIGVEYENFKNYKEFGQNGEKLINTYRAIWARDL